MGQVFRIGNRCMSIHCSCCQYDNKPIKDGAPTPPLHDGCDCYLIEKLDNKEVLMQSVEEGKARLIVKRIVADLAIDQSVPLSCEWESLNPETREAWVKSWTDIAREVLGEEVEPIDPLRAVDDLCKQIGHDNVMNRASLDWMVNEVGSRIVGQKRSDLISCSCGGDGDGCEWCSGADGVTLRVKQAMEEAERPKEEKETHEEYGGDPNVWNQFLFHTGWTESFVDRMRERGAVKIDVPMGPTGSISVVFPKLSEVTSGALRLTQDEREMIISELRSGRDEKSPETE